jgi:hypothetical protein
MSFFSTPMKQKNNQQIDLLPFHFHGMRTRERERGYMAMRAYLSKEKKQKIVPSLAVIEYILYIENRQTVSII